MSVELAPQIGNMTRSPFFHGNIAVQRGKRLYYYEFVKYVRVLSYVNTIL